MIMCSTRRGGLANSSPRSPITIATSCCQPHAAAPSANVSSLPARHLVDAWTGFLEPASYLESSRASRRRLWLAWARNDRLVAWDCKAQATRLPTRSTLRGGHSPFEIGSFTAG